MNRDGAYKIERRLSEYVVQPVQYSVAEKIRSHLGWVEIDGLRLPVLWLEYEVEAYLKLGRVEKAAMLHKWLEHRQTG